MAVAAGRGRGAGRTGRADPDRDLIRRRLASQQIAAPQGSSPLELVRRLGAVQAQDYAGGLWAIGLRLAGATEADVERAVGEAAIVRTWPLRRTLHFVPAEDARWMLRLHAPRLLASSAGRFRQLGLDETDFARARRILTRALRGGRRLTRAAAYERLARGGVDPAGQRGIHVIAHLSQLGLLCYGPREERQPTVVLLEEWVPPAADPPRDEALALLAARYFAGHGPATLQDFTWWSGLLAGEARRAVEAAGAAVVEERRGEVTMYASAEERAASARGRTAGVALLPPWDEYLVAYRDRAAATRGVGAEHANPLQLVGRPVLVVDGRVRGSWRRELRPGRVRVTLEPWTELAAAERRALDRALARYGRFLGREVEVIE